MRKNLFLFAILFLGFVSSIHAADVTTFEGEIQYRNFENHSSLIRRFSSGMAYNGARDIKIIMKGNKMHVIDESMHIHTIFLPDEDKVILYSDVAKKGLFTSYKEFVPTYYELFSPSKKTNQYSIKNMNERQYKDEKCSVYSGQIIITPEGTTNSTTTDAELWVSHKYKIDKCYLNYIYGIDVPGVVLKWSYKQEGKVPLLGKMSSYVASEIKNISERAVSDSEFEVPSDVSLKDSGSPFKLLGIYKENKKFLKKNKMYPTDADKDNEVTYKIDEEWDF